jgi:hypothetical protein
MDVTVFGIFTDDRELHRLQMELLIIAMFGGKFNVINPDDVNAP